MVSKNIIVLVPKDIRVNSVTTYIRKINSIFQNKWKEIPHFYLSFANVSRVDLLGVLLTYKILEYNLIYRCFNRPTHDINSNEILNSYIRKYGFTDLIKSLSNDNKNVDEKDYRKLQVISNDDCLIAPIALLRSDSKHASQVIRRQYEPIISSFYREHPDAVDMILGVFSEIMLNFMTHASDDRSVIVGYGSKTSFEIACADNGIGIDGTMKERFRNLPPQRAVLMAMEKNVTSKANTNHMGYGLWFINQIVRKNSGKLLVISNNSLYSNIGGSVSIIECPKWEGTVVYIKLDISKPINIQDISEDKREVKINFI